MNEPEFDDPAEHLSFTRLTPARNVMDPREVFYRAGVQAGLRAAAEDAAKSMSARVSWRPMVAASLATAFLTLPIGYWLSQQQAAMAQRSIASPVEQPSADDEPETIETPETKTTPQMIVKSDAADPGSTPANEGDVQEEPSVGLRVRSFASTLPDWATRWQGRRGDQDTLTAYHGSLSFETEVQRLGSIDTADAASRDGLQSRRRESVDESFRQETFSVGGFRSVGDFQKLTQSLETSY